MVPIYRNQAIATIPATYTPDGLVLADGRTLQTYLHPKTKAWFSNKMLPLQFEATFRVWPRYNRDGFKSVEVVGVAPREQAGIVAGKVVGIDGKQVTVRVKPKGERINPFHVQLINHNEDFKPKAGWRTRFEVVWQDGHLVITASQPLHQGKSQPAPATTEVAIAETSTEPPPTPTQALQHKPKPEDHAVKTAQARYHSLMAQAQAASNPRMQQQFKQLAQAILAKAGLEPKQLKT